MQAIKFDLADGLQVIINPAHIAAVERPEDYPFQDKDPEGCVIRISDGMRYHVKPSFDEVWGLFQQMAAQQNARDVLSIQPQPPFQVSPS